MDREDDLSLGWLCAIMLVFLLIILVGEFGSPSEVDSGKGEAVLQLSFAPPQIMAAKKENTDSSGVVPSEVKIGQLFECLYGPGSGSTVIVEGGKSGEDVHFQLDKSGTTLVVQFRHFHDDGEFRDAFAVFEANRLGVMITGWRPVAGHELPEDGLKVLDKALDRALEECLRR